MAMTAMPALAVIGTPTKRNAILELAAEAERRGFAGLASPGVHGNLALCGSLAHVTKTIPFWTSIQPIYHGHPVEVAITAGHLHEVSGGRFRLGIGVSHAAGDEPPRYQHRQAVARHGASTSRRCGRRPGQPVRCRRSTWRRCATRCSIWRWPMADGAIWANASRRYMPTQIARVQAAARDNFFLANMVPTVIDADLDAARAIHRRTLAGYVIAPELPQLLEAGGL